MIIIGKRDGIVNGGSLLIRQEEKDLQKGVVLVYLIIVPEEYGMTVNGNIMDRE